MTHFTRRGRPLLRGPITATFVLVYDKLSEELGEVITPLRLIDKTNYTPQDAEEGNGLLNSRDSFL